MTRESLITRLRPEPEPLDPTWSATTLESILAEPLPTRTPWRRRHAATFGAVALATVLGAGGAAWTTGMLTGTDDEAPSGVPELVLRWGGAELAAKFRILTDVTLPDGTGFVTWQAKDHLHDCIGFAHFPVGATRDDGWNGGAGCGEGELPVGLVPIKVAVVANEARVFDTVDGPDPTYWYPVVHGTTATSATSVHITGTFAWTGRSMDLVLPVDPATGGFAGALPERWPVDGYEGVPLASSGLTFTFHDSHGRVLDTVCDCDVAAPR